MPKPYFMPNDGYMRLVDVLKVFPVSKTTWWAGVKDGRFPQPVKLSARITAWRVSDIRKLLQLASKQRSLADLTYDWRAHAEQQHLDELA